jgi:hypothetical protein
MYHDLAHSLIFAQNIDRSIKAYVTTVQKDAVRSLAVTMRDNLDDVAQKGYEYLNDTVRKWFWNTIRAVISREGTYKSSKRGLIQWNEKFKQPTARHLAEEWRKLFLLEREHMTTAEKKIKGDLDALRSDLEGTMILSHVEFDHD